MKKVSVVALVLFVLIFCLISLLPDFSVSAEDIKSASTIGSLEVESQNYDEILREIEIKINEWKESPIILNIDDGPISLNPDWFIFDMDTSADNFFNEISKPWYVFWEKDTVSHLPLKVKLNQSLKNELLKYSYLNQEETLLNIQKHAEVLSNERIEAVSLDLSLLETERQAFSLEEIGSNMVDLPQIMEKLNNQVVPNGQIFSFNEKVQTDNISYNEETLNFVASLIYSAILQTNFEIIERHSQLKVPTYLEPGTEVKVDFNSLKDFKFKNINEIPFLLKVSSKENEILVELYSVPFNLKGEYQILEKETITPRTIYRYSASLQKGEEVIVQEGVEGLKVTVQRTISDKKGPYESQEFVSTDYYPPTHRILLRAIEDPIEIDQDLEVDLNGDGLPDSGGNSVEESNSQGQINENEVSENIHFETLPKGSYYDKAGNIITPK